MPTDKYLPIIAKIFFYFSAFPCNQEGFRKVKMEHFPVDVTDSQFPIHFEDGPIHVSSPETTIRNSQDQKGYVSSPGNYGRKKQVHILQPSQQKILSKI